MADDNIHDLFTKSDDAGLGSIDTASVIRRSKRRRLPAQLATGGALALALGGFGVFGVQTIVNAPQFGATDGEALMFDGELQYSTEEGAGDGAIRDEVEAEGRTISPLYDALALCGGPLPAVAPAPSGLEITVDFPDAATGTDMVVGTAELTNTGSEPVVGYTAMSPHVLLSQDGVVTWHSNGGTRAAAIHVDLAPGESLTYAAFFTPVTCAPTDDATGVFRKNLPAAPAGAYQVSAAIDLLDGDTVELVTGPSSSVTLR